MVEVYDMHGNVPPKYIMVMAGSMMASDPFGTSTREACLRHPHRRVCLRGRRGGQPHSTAPALTTDFLAIWSVTLVLFGLDRLPLPRE